MASDVETSDARAAIDPLRPLIAASRALATVVLVTLLLGTVAAVFGSGSVLTIGDDPICATVTAGREVPMTSTNIATQSPGWGLLGPRVNPIEDRYQLCQDHPNAKTQVLGFLADLPDFLLLLGFLAGVFILVRRTRIAGLFSRPVARAVHWLGWYVLAGALLASIVRAVATSGLVRQMLPHHHFFDFSGYWHVSIATLLAGAGILTIARVLRLTVEMQEDLDATI